MFREQWDVFSTLAERRKVERDDVDSVIEIFAKLSFADELFEILVGGRYDTHVHFDGMSPADAGEFPLLKDSQQFGLSHSAEIPNFVEEQGTGVCEFKLSDPAGCCIGKGALFVPEELAFDQSFRQCGTVQRNERTIPPSAVVMESLGDQFLTGTTFSRNEDGDTAVGDLFNFAVDFLHRAAFPDEVMKGAPLGNLRT